jgi:hypothetical protein
MRPSRTISRLAVVTTLATSLLAMAPAQAVPAPKATGSILMSNPQQAIDFAVFEPPHAPGNLTYTNFELADPGSGVWVPSATFDVGFAVDPDTAIVATYGFTVTEWHATSPTRVVFSGNGDGPDPWYGPFTGVIDGSTFSFTLTETDGVQSFTMNAVGTIDANGAVTGTWSDNYGAGRTGTFAVADVGDEVFSFTATPTCVQVNDAGTKARFGYTIPAGAPAGLAGQPVAVKVVDGGSPGSTYDTYKHNFATAVGSCLPVGGTYSEYPITAGNLTVFA